jgi:hypothetical protein
VVQPVATAKKARLETPDVVMEDDVPPVEMMQDVFKVPAPVSMPATPVKNVVVAAMKGTPSAASFILQAIRPAATPAVYFI